MEIISTLNETKLTLKVKGELNTMTAPELERALKSSLNGIEELVLDFSELEYVTSAGLRVILAAQNVMDKQGKLVITGPNDEIKEIFEVTGFLDFLTIE